jgi:hypothetical protein
MLADMRKNMIIADPAGFDNLTVNASGTKIKAWVTGQDVVLELETSRLDLEQLGSILEDDWRRYRSFVDKQSRENPRFRDFAYIPGQRDATGIRTMRTLIGVNYVGEQISPAELNHRPPEGGGFGSRLKARRKEEQKAERSAL